MIQLTVLPAVFLSAMFTSTEAANILVMLPNCMYSHIHNFKPIINELAVRGHNVTMVTAFPEKQPLPNLKQFIVPNFAEEIMATVPNKNLLEMQGVMFSLFSFWMFGLLGTRKALEHETVQKFIKDTDSKFDLIFVETWFLQEPFVAFGHKFNAPVINLMPQYLFPQAAHLTGNYFPCTYVPISKFGAFNDRMTFLERAQNCLFHIWEVVIGEVYYLRQQEALMKQYFTYPGSENLPPLVDMLKNTSLTLADYNFALGYPMPLHRNVIEFGGLTMKKTEKLPKDLQNFMDKAKDGVIYFSLGSHANFSYLKPETQKEIFTVFRNLKQKVIMKLEEGYEFKNYANENLLIKSWFPQAAIVAHPNCKLFITHGGLHGLIEAIYNAVPMIVIPLFGDQPMNAKFIETTGIGYVLTPESITRDKLTYATNHVLNNPIYKENIKRRSAIFKDRPGDTLEHALYWIEYVIRHKGAPHLRPAVLDLHWYQYLMLDVIAFYLLILAFITYVIKIVFKLLFVCLRCILYKNSDTSSKDYKPKSKKQ